MYGIESSTRPMIADAMTSVGSASGFASPFVRTYRPSGRSTTASIRWVKIALASATRIETTSPGARFAGSTGTTTMAEPIGIAGSIERPPIASVSRPVSGTSFPRTTPARTTRISVIRAMSTIRRSQTVAAERIFIAVPPDQGTNPWTDRPGPDAGAGVAAARGRRRWRTAGGRLPKDRAAARLVRRTAAGGTAGVFGLRVVGGLLGVERERGGRGRALEAVRSGQREADPEAQDLARAGGQGAVAGLGALGGAAERGPVQVRRGHDRRAGERGAAAAGILGLDRQLDRGPEGVGRRRRHRVAELGGAAVRHGQRLGVHVARHHRVDRREGRRVDADVDRAGREVPSGAGRVRELGERDGAGPDREHRDRAQRGDDPAAPPPAALDPVLRVLIHADESPSDE